MQLPGADAGKPDVKGAAEKAVKKTPLGFMNVGELAFDLPGSNVSKDDLPNNVKPGDAAGLPKGPTAKPPSLPNLPKVRTCYQSMLHCSCERRCWIDMFAVCPCMLPVMPEDTASVPASGNAMSAHLVEQQRPLPCVQDCLTANCILLLLCRLCIAVIGCCAGSNMSGAHAFISHANLHPMDICIWTTGTCDCHHAELAGTMQMV